MHRAGLCLTEEGKVLTAGRAKKDTPMREKVAAISRPSHVLGVLSPYPIVARVICGHKDQDWMSEKQSKQLCVNVTMTAV